MIDREYTSPALAIRLRKMGYDMLGTCAKTRHGFPDSIKVATKNRPAGMERGTYVVAKHKTVDDMYAVRWVDNKQVYFLSTGVGVVRSNVVRKLKSGDRVNVPCPEVVEKYNETMAGVDSHDQLRLYSTRYFYFELILLSCLWSFTHFLIPLCYV